MGHIEEEVKIQYKNKKSFYVTSIRLNLISVGNFRNSAWARIHYILFQEAWFVVVRFVVQIPFSLKYIIKKEIGLTSKEAYLACRSPVDIYSTMAHNKFSIVVLSYK